MVGRWVESILKAKGRSVHTIGPSASLVLAVHQLSSLGIGALVVTNDGRRADGLVGEREAVRGLAKHGGLSSTCGSVTSWPPRCLCARPRTPGGASSAAAPRP